MTYTAAKGVRSAYVSGPMFSSGRLTTNTHKAVLLADILVGWDIIPFVSHVHSTFWDFISPHDSSFWLKIDRHWLSMCNLMIRIDGLSAGSDQEESWCGKWNKPVVTIPQDFSFEHVRDALLDQGLLVRKES